MAKEQLKLTYLELDPANFSAKQKAAAKKVEAAQAVLKEAVAGFVQASAEKAQTYFDHIQSNGGVVGGNQMQISTRFGKYSVFFVADRATGNKRSMKI